MRNFIKRTFLLAASIFLFSLLTTNAQEWLNEPYLDRSNPDISFYDIQKAFDEWAEDKDLVK